MNKFNINDFNKKIDDSASKLDELIDRASKVNNVGDMLDQTNNRLNETLKTLKDIYEDLSILNEQFEQSKKQLSDTASLLNSTSEDLIQKMDTLNSDLTDKMAQTEIKLDSIASHTKKILYTIIVFLILGTSYYLYKFKVFIF